MAMPMLVLAADALGDDCSNGSLLQMFDWCATAPHWPPPPLTSMSTRISQPPQSATTSATRNATVRRPATWRSQQLVAASWQLAVVDCLKF